MSSCEKIPQIRPIEITSYSRNVAGNMIYCVYKNSSSTEKNLGNEIKQGSSGNSYKQYILRKRGCLV